MEDFKVQFQQRLMMKCLLIAMMVSRTIAGPTTPEGEKLNLPIPAITSIRTFEAGFEVSWSPVVSPVAHEPILGYKVNVWEPDIQTVFKYDNVNGANMLVESTVPLDPNIFDSAPKRPPKFSVVTRENSARFTQVRTGLFYEIRVQALTGRDVGPMSLATSVKLHNPTEKKRPPKKHSGELIDLY